METTKKLQRTHIKDARDKVGETLMVKGFVHVVRNQGKIIFLLVRDVTGVVQTVVTQKTPELFELAESLSTESVVKIIGEAVAVEQAPSGFEIKVADLEVLSTADPELPIPVIIKSGDETEMTKRFDWRWIDLRKPEKQKIFKIWTELEKGYRDYFNSNDYVQLYTPAFMSTPSESGADVFEVTYFERKAYLAQSPQFYKQMAMASGLEKVFMVGSVFRAEQSFTTRHMTEFTGWDFEISYIDSHFDVMTEMENATASGFAQLKKTLLPDLEIPSTPFPKFTMKEAKEKLAKEGITSKADFDVSPEEERALSEIVKKETGHDFVFLTDYPIEGRPFYHMCYADDPETTKSFDLLYKGVEIVTGAQREHRADVLVAQAKEKGMELDELQDYINFFRYGCPPHGGVGIGPSRIIMQILGLASVKEATFLPRDVKRLTP